jgi:hypothetical protein
MNSGSFGAHESSQKVESSLSEDLQVLTPGHFVGLIGMTKQLDEKVLIFCQFRGEHSSGAKARIYFALFTPGINPRPTARNALSAGCKVMP